MDQVTLWLPGRPICNLIHFGDASAATSTFLHPTSTIDDHSIHHHSMDSRRPGAVNEPVVEQTCVRRWPIFELNHERPRAISASRAWAAHPDFRKHAR